VESSVAVHRVDDPEWPNWATHIDPPLFVEDDGRDAIDVPDDLAPGCASCHATTTRRQM
jgi:hypothetical protein